MVWDLLLDLPPPPPPPLVWCVLEVGGGGRGGKINVEGGRESRTCPCPVYGLEETVPGGWTINTNNLQTSPAESLVWDLLLDSPPPPLPMPSHLVYGGSGGGSKLVWGGGGGGEKRMSLSYGLEKTVPGGWTINTNNLQTSPAESVVWDLLPDPPPPSPPPPHPIVWFTLKVG